MVDIAPDTWNQISIGLMDWAIALKSVDTTKYAHNLS